MYSKTKLIVSCAVLWLASQHLLMAQHAGRPFEVKENRAPRKAAIRSAVLPGWGQVYNKKIWKVPIVYGALGVIGSLLAYNLNWYKKFRAGVRVGDYLIKAGSGSKDSAGYFALDRTVKLYLGNGGGIETLRMVRDDARKNMVYPGLYFLVAWGLNVVDAAVDAHLSSFEVSDNLLFGVKPAIDMGSRTAGLSLVLRTK